MNNSDSIVALLNLIRIHDVFAISSHVRPDGDAIGSALGMMHLLEALGKQATVVFVDSIPPNFHFLSGADRISRHFPEAEALILLECDSIERSSIDRSEFDAHRPALIINIDHHRSGRPFADFNWIDAEAAAVGTMVYDLAIAAGIKVTADMAECLYAAILTDTGSFNYPGTVASTFAMAEHLIHSGANANRLARAIYFCNPASKVRLLGIALSNLQIEGPVSWSYVTLAEMESVGASVEDCEGVANHLIGIAGIEGAAFLRELPGKTQFRLSLRSRGALDVSKIAEHFGGGGHQSASGCTMDGTLAKVTKDIVEELRSACQRMNPTAPKLQYSR
ncbi:MAG: bifunctional oligoribonuclease/PAP phosphatase NrnA [Acidobacteria bacterium]|nr:bifunctional oligoribonuclease/PAP phosphatase NrnA [Acidobacteriota bacterium]